MIKPEVLYVGDGPSWYLERFAQHFTLRQLADADPAALDPAIANRIQALIAAAPVSATLMDRLPSLRLIANGGAGYEKIDVDAACSRGIAVTNTPNVTDGCVADMVFALLLAVTRNIVAGDRFIRDGRWPNGSFPLVPRVNGKRMGILGLGRIGLAIAKRAQAFDMEVSYCNRRSNKDLPFAFRSSPEALARDCDFLVVACPGGVATHHLVDSNVLAALGPRGVVVNISRGSVIDEQALIEALAQGRIAGAGLDVFEEEPNVPVQLRALDNVVLMPHRGGGTYETWEDACDLVKANLSAFFNGQPLLTPVTSAA